MCHWWAVASRFRLSSHFRISSSQPEISSDEMASPDLVWLCVRNSSSFIKKSNGITLTNEPGNLTGENSFKYSGLANNKTVDVVPTKGKKNTRPVLVKKAKKLRSVEGRKCTTYLNIDLTQSSKRISTQLQKGNYRPDLIADAEKKYLKVRGDISKTAAGGRPVKKGRKPRT
ncbi:unnamed protein product [Vitrella brassicaformis CCMP3155]|uniref:Ribosomal eL28/Mak16 domain-containing protein n=1 Tax=Vitrella brassicaformis (strain CCMP3155) TaxID=1169540 RepID=A0A0G4EZP5_VITBC|nr:unnamed protein product [Vitrella brassicaformis CCMP3155]|eukprot:CEM04613.1 unnamed protein product [Vitrella brassicaformis CCMP3155]